MRIADLVKRTDQLIELGSSVLATRYTEGIKHPIAFVKEAPMAGFRSAALSFIERTFGREHSHFLQFSAKTDSSFASDAERGIAILRAIRDELSGGWLFSMKSLVAAELFADFLEQAEHLLSQGHKDAAAVMIGSILEEHLRQLCIKNGLEVNDDRDGRTIPRKADRLNSELAKISAYSALDSKQVTAWLSLRNNAAHGKYDQYTSEQVKNLLSGVLEFMVRVSP